MHQDPLTGKVIGCASEVLWALGPGLLESTYKQCLALTYFKLSGITTGLLINFKTKLLKNGIA